MPRHYPAIRATLNRPSGAIQLNVMDLKQLVIDQFEAFNDHDLDAWIGFLSDDFAGEAPGAPAPMNQEQTRAYQQSFITAFPDLTFDFERFIAEGDFVVVDWKATGTHDGPLATPNGQTIPPTKKQATVYGSTTYKVGGGRIMRAWVHWDMMTLLAQLGLMPEASAAAAGAQAAGQAPKAASTARREIVHMEIPAADREAAAHFYNELFGWEFEHMGPPMNYTTFATGNIGGGFPDLGEMYEPGDVLVYLYSDDIDADLRRIESRGGQTVMPSTEISGFGWFAVFSDPTGNRLALYTARVE